MRGKTHIFTGQNGPAVTIRLTDPRLHFRLFFNAQLALGEAYSDGSLILEEGSVYDFLDICLANQRTLDNTTLQKIFGIVRGLQSAFRTYNPIGLAQRKVAHHYDLRDELFDLFLDSDRQYSCAYFHHSEESLEEAQLNKLARLAAKLNLQDGDSVLDIGCGWGGLASAFALCRDSVNVTGITLSQQQFAYACQASAGAKLDDRLKFKLRDYRMQTGTFQKIVSVGMLEHVGPRGLPIFFIHTIAMPHSATPVNRWLTRYIFPGGYLPSIQQLISVTEGRGLKLLDMEIMRGHYAETLRHWRLRFEKRREIMAEKYDERFVRMWEFYLLGCEYFFRCQHGMVVQLQLSDDQQSVPKSRAYVNDLESRFKNRLLRSPSVF